MDEGRFLLTSGQHRARAQVLRATNPQSRAAQLHDLAAAMIEAGHASTAQFVDPSPSLVP
jgi:hypothetical protein